MAVNRQDYLAKLKATEVRRSFGLNEEEPVDVIKLLHEWDDVNFVFKPLSKGISGMFLRIETVQVIIINSAKSFGHQRFTTAHEYYHLKYNQGVSLGVCIAGLFNQKVQDERDADYFAANLLMPGSAIANRVLKRTGGKKRELHTDDVIGLEQHFGVSHAAMLMRLKQLRYLSQTQVDFMGPNIINNARILGYDINLYRATNEERIYSSYAEKAKRALDEDLISVGKYEELMLEAGLADLLYGGEEEESHEDI